MSKIALLIGANPKSFVTGAVVRLLPGNYTIHTDGLKDSILNIRMGSVASMISNLLHFSLAIPTDVVVDFVKRGTESYINIFAESA